MAEKKAQTELLQQKLAEVAEKEAAAKLSATAPIGGVSQPPPPGGPIKKKAVKKAGFLSSLKKQASKAKTMQGKVHHVTGCDTNIKKALQNPNSRVTSGIM